MGVQPDKRKQDTEKADVAPNLALLRVAVLPLVSLLGVGISSTQSPDSQESNSLTKPSEGPRGQSIGPALKLLLSSQQISSNVSPDQLAPIIAASNQFAVELFNALAPKNENFVFSPLSVYRALGLTLAGAKGRTAQEMIEVMGLAGIDPQLLHSFIGGLVSGEDQLLLERNFVLASSKIKLTDAFVATVKTFYGALLAQLNPEDPGALSTVNDLVREATSGKIERVMERLDPKTKLLLINALNFKATWRYPFNPEKTEPGFFYRPEGKLTVPFMHAEGYFEYVETSRYKRVALPYADSQYAMSVFLPAEDLSVAEFVRSFEPQMLTEKPQRTERQRMSIFPREIGVVMPKFEFLSASVLPDALKKLGLQSIFDQRLADLSGTSVDGDLFVSDILQSAALGVDEAGTTAAAGTVVVEHTRSAGPQEEIVFSRPFVCVIHNQAGEIVFIAQIERP